MTANQNQIKIPQFFNLRGVSFYQETINNLKNNDTLHLEKDPENKYDSNAIKVLDENGNMCGFIPKKYKINNEEFILNELIFKKFDKITSRYHIKIKSIYKWDGPTGLEIKFQPKSV